MLFLTRREQTVTILILAAVVAGAAVRHFRISSMVPGAGIAATHRTGGNR